MVIYQKDLHHQKKTEANALPASEPNTKFVKWKERLYPRHRNSVSVIKTTAKFCLL